MWMRQEQRPTGYLQQFWLNLHSGLDRFAEQQREGEHAATAYQQAMLNVHGKSPPQVL